MKLKKIFEEFTKEKIIFYELSPKRVESDGLDYVKHKLKEVSFNNYVRFISNAKTKKVIVFKEDVLHNRASKILNIPYSFKIHKRDVNYFFGIGVIKDNKIEQIEDIELNDFILMFEDEKYKDYEDEDIKLLKEIRKALDGHPSFLNLMPIKNRIDAALKKITSLNS